MVEVSILSYLTDSVDDLPQVFFDLRWVAKTPTCCWRFEVMNDYVDMLASVIKNDARKH